MTDQQVDPWESDGWLEWVEETADRMKKLAAFAACFDDRAVKASRFRVDVKGDLVEWSREWAWRIVTDGVVVRSGYSSLSKQTAGDLGMNALMDMIDASDAQAAEEGWEAIT